MSLLGERLADKVSKFNSQINRHLESQQLNPFSGQFSRSPSPRPFAKDEYGKPVAGSLTEVRGHRAQSHICKEVLELCEIIQELGEYNKRQREKHRDPNDEDDEDDIPDDGTIIVTFGELFQMYTKISNKVVGLLLAAKKRGLVYFEGEMLFQRRDDNVLIALIKPIEEIRRILKESISPAPLDDEPSVGC
ncbi:actin-binding Rho-activating protein [Nilaparvata lugens]|uniref:actin-binding Rho-activating protein n=1 Tax=Nilaparvata lugens TaxID=108931 RepID=UPI00193E2E09|nr:actin-binding Rho-activating protein [Nilaparvata lugens]